MSERLPLGPMAVVVAALVTGLLTTFLVGAFGVEITADLGTGPALIGRAVSAFFLTAAVSSLVAGRIVDRVGARIGYRIGLAAVAASGLSAGLLVRSGWQLVLALAVGGVAIAFIDPSIARTIIGAVAPSRQGIAFGVKESAVAVASMSAGVALPLLAGRAGWQVPFLAVATAALLLAAVIPGGIDPGHPAARRTRPLTVPSSAAGSPQRATPTEPAEPATPSGPAGSAGAEEAGTRAGNGQALALLAVAAGLAGGSGAVVATYLVTAGVAAGLPPGRAALLLSLGSAISIGVRLAAGWQADRLVAGPLTLLAGLLALGTVGIGALALAASLSGAGTEVAGATPLVVGLLVVGAVLALGPGWGWTALVFLLAVRLAPGRPAQSTGAMLAGLGGGGAVLPLVAGTLVERLGFAGTWSAVAACMAAAVVLVTVLHHRTAND